MHLPTFSAVLTLIAVLAMAWTAAESWRPTPLLASADRPKFPFGGKRREPEPEPSGPDLLDEVAGGRYGGGQTMLPTLGQPGDGRPERKLPRLFPDPQSPADADDDGGFDDDLIDWAPAPPPPPPPPPSAASPQNPGDPGWPLEMGLLEAIANMPESAGPPAHDAPWGDRPDPWASLGDPASASAHPALPLDPAPVPPSSADPQITSWGRPERSETIDWSTSETPDPWAASASIDPATSEADADSWHSWQWQTEAGASPAAVEQLDDPFEPSLDEPAADDASPGTSWFGSADTPTPATLTWDTAPESAADDRRPFTWPDDAPTAAIELSPAPLEGAETPLPVRPVTRSQMPDIDSTDHWFAAPPAPVVDDAPFDRDALLGHDAPFDRDALLGHDAPFDRDALLVHDDLPEPFGVAAGNDHDVDLASEVGDEPDDFDRDAQLGDPALDDLDTEHAPLDLLADARPRIDATLADAPVHVVFPSSLSADDDADRFAGAVDEAPADDDAWHDEPLVAHDPFGVAATVVSVPLGTEPAAPTQDRTGDSWSDLYSIFGSDDTPLETPATEPFAHEAPAVSRPAESGDQWASSLLDRLRSVVATPTEPVEALDEFDARFARGLRLRLTDQQVMHYLGQGVHLIAPDAEVQVLLAADGQDFVEASSEGPASRTACAVDHADLCPAVVQEETLRFENSNDLDACPFLSERATGACAAVCVPLGASGEARGVVHITTLRNATLPESTVTAIEAAAGLVGDRLVELHITRERRRTRSVTD